MPGGVRRLELFKYATYGFDFQHKPQVHIMSGLRWNVSDFHCLTKPPSHPINTAVFASPPLSMRGINLFVILFVFLGDLPPLVWASGDCFRVPLDRIKRDSWSYVKFLFTIKTLSSLIVSAWPPQTKANTTNKGVNRLNFLFAETCVTCLLNPMQCLSPSLFPSCSPLSSSCLFLQFFPPVMSRACFTQSKSPILPLPSI